PQPQPADENPPPQGGQAKNAAPEAVPAVVPAAIGGAGGTGSLALPAVAKASLQSGVEGAQGVAGGSQGAAVELWLNPKGVEVAPGDRFTVRLEANALDPVSHLPLTLSYDPKVLAVEKVEPGDFLGAKGTAQVLADTSHAGRVVIGASRLGAVPGVAGHGTVAVVTFRALIPGKSRLGLDESKALDRKLRAMAVSARPADVTVGGERPDRPPRPEPKPPKVGEASRTSGG
ncbi:MAG: ral secretion pathway protein, partial [Acidobacteriota bacterium]|nr:ral secretion pathway protein [Acidobacteriota bacterium]